jgi:hypothetical protein
MLQRLQIREIKYFCINSVSPTAFPARQAPTYLQIFVYIIYLFTLIIHMIIQIKYCGLVGNIFIFYCFINCFFTQEWTPHILRFYFCYTVMIPAAPQETVGEAGIEPGTAA